MTIFIDLQSMYFTLLYAFVKRDWSWIWILLTEVSFVLRLTEIVFVIPGEEIF